MTRRHQQETTLSAGLSITQETALLALMSGATQGEAAERAGVTRETVCRWLQDDPEFVAALNRARKEVWDASVDRLRLLALKATEVLAKLLESDDPRMRLSAVQLALKSTGLDALSAPIGPLDATEVERAQRNAAVQQELADMLSAL